MFKVNEDPKRLDDAYVRMLGPGGDKVLNDEAKWLAVTHKSFDHGRRGFNDRLAYLGACWDDSVWKDSRLTADRTKDSRATDLAGSHKLPSS